MKSLESLESVVVVRHADIYHQLLLIILRCWDACAQLFRGAAARQRRRDRVAHRRRRRGRHRRRRRRRRRYRGPVERKVCGSC